MSIPTVDTKTGIITGCKTAEEFAHEKAHLEFAEKKASVQWLHEVSTYYTLIFIVAALFIDIFKYFALVSISLSLFCFVFEEIWCNDKAETKSLNNAQIMKKNIEAING